MSLLQLFQLNLSMDNFCLVANGFHLTINVKLFYTFFLLLFSHTGLMYIKWITISTLPNCDKCMEIVVWNTILKYYCGDWKIMIKIFLNYAFAAFDLEWISNSEKTECFLCTHTQNHIQYHTVWQFSCFSSSYNTTTTTTPVACSFHSAINDWHFDFETVKYVCVEWYCEWVTLNVLKPIQLRPRLEWSRMETASMFLFCFDFIRWL